MKFGIIKTGGKQYKVEAGQILTIEKLDSTVGQSVIFDQILLTSDDTNTQIGTPLVEKAKVEGEIIQQGRAKKVLIFKYKPKTRYRVKRGHRQPFSKVKITKLDF